MLGDVRRISDWRRAAHLVLFYIWNLKLRKIKIILLMAKYIICCQPQGQSQFTQTTNLFFGSCKEDFDPSGIAFFILTPVLAMMTRCSSTKTFPMLETCFIRKCMERIGSVWKIRQGQFGAWSLESTMTAHTSTCWLKRFHIHMILFGVPLHYLTDSCQETQGVYGASLHIFNLSIWMMRPVSINILSRNPIGVIRLSTIKLRTLLHEIQSNHNHISPRLCGPTLWFICFEASLWSECLSLLPHVHCEGNRRI